MQPSTYPAAAARLVDLLRAAVDPDAVDVRDGPVKGQPRGTIIVVDYSTQDRAGVEIGTVDDDLRSNPEETWVLRGMTLGGSGDVTDAAVRLARANASAGMDALRRVLADRTLDGTCGKCALGAQQWFTAVTDHGIEIQVEWEIRGWGLL
jgi:hypothetical protein